MRGEKNSTNISKVFCKINHQVNKEYGRLYVYDRAVAETKPGDSYFKYIEQIWKDDVLRLVFTNTGLDRYYLDITDPAVINENEKEILVEKASLVTWNGLYHFNKFDTRPYTITFKLEQKIVIQTEEFMDVKHMRRY